MAIKKIKISNFRSFDEVNLELGKFNVVIGANASGKSNIVQIFKFLRDLTNFGLENAISMQGGVEYFRNINIGPSKHFSIEVTCDIHDHYLSAEKAPELEVYETTYKFVLEFRERGTNFDITQDKLSQKCNFYRNIKRQRKTIREELGKGEIVASRIKNERSLILTPPEGVKVDPEDIFEISLTKRALDSVKIMSLKTLFLESPRRFLIGSELKRQLGDISVYDFDPKLPKKAQAITGRVELEEDGRNLAVALKNIMRSGNDRRKLFNLLRAILPFVDDLSTETFADKSLMFKLREAYSGKRFLPASLISDGTINLTALIIALYFEDKPLKIIEEPERNIHPYLISKIANMMQEASEITQLICTTHNPEMIKHVDLNDILLIRRDKDGFSRISRPAEKEEIKVFLKEMGIEELYIRNLLEM